MKIGTLNAKLIGKNPNETPYQYFANFLEEHPDFDMALLTYYK